MARVQYLSIALCLFAYSALAQITFTGNATGDFEAARVDINRNRTFLAVPNTNRIVGSDWMTYNGLMSGFDLKSFYVQYDWETDTLFAAMDCWVICGDADGDGNPSVSTDRGNQWNVVTEDRPDITAIDPNRLDTHLQADYEFTAISLWTYPPADFQPDGYDITIKEWTGYYPDIGVGDSPSDDLSNFHAYALDSEHICFVNEEREYPEDSEECQSQRATFFNTIASNFQTEYSYFRYIQNNTVTDFPTVSISRYPNSTWPDIEWTMEEFSRYGKFNFVPGRENIRFSFSVSMGSSQDAAGEETQYPMTLSIPCMIVDACGECDGDNSTCADCAGVPNGLSDYDACGHCVLPEDRKVIDECGNCVFLEDSQVIDDCGDCVDIENFNQGKDACGVCHGDNTTCDDCFGVPHGNATYDQCGVCGGDNTACDDCFGVPNGKAVYDECGICNGTNTVCADCNGTPNGDYEIDTCGDCVAPADRKTYDSCGVCGGHNEDRDDCGICFGLNKDKDECGTCFGHNEICSDCLGIPNGNATYDDCDVCNGNNTACADCAGIPNGPYIEDGCGNCVLPEEYQTLDDCGVCGGDNSACADCAGVTGNPVGPHIYDGCGRCVLPENYHQIDACGECRALDDQGWLDRCGVCRGNNTYCADCSGTVNGTKTVDVCGNCLEPADHQFYDDCGVCGGFNKDKDECGECFGNNTRCADCAGTVNGTKTIDICGDCLEPADHQVVDACNVCGGLNKSMDDCGVCFGDNSTCADCEGTPHGTKVYDLCGTCGGNNEECECYIYTNLTIQAKDTWISLENRTQNYGKDVTLEVSSDRKRTLLRFDDIRFQINGATEQRPEILSAKIRLFLRGDIQLKYMGWVEDQKLALHNLEHNFCDEKATWECRDYDTTGCCVQWRMLSLYPKVRADYEFQELAVYELEEGHRGWIEFDVKEDIEKFMAESFLNSKSYLVKKSCETDWGWIKFWSCDSVGHLNCPELDIKLKSRCHAPVEPEPEPTCN